MFTMFESATICLLYLLYNCFESLHIFKPCTSKSGNSEVYVICLKYKGKEDFLQIRDKLLTYYENPNSNFVMFSLEAVPNKFISQVEECNMFFMSKQIKTINDNVYCFKNVLPNEYRKNEDIKNGISQCFMHKYNIRIIDKVKYLTDRKYYNSIPEVFIYDGIYEDNIENILFGNKFNIEYPNIELHYITGKEISKVLYSEFCDINILSNFQNSDHILLSSIFIESLEKLDIKYECIIPIHYSKNNKVNLLNLYHSFYDAINKINCGHNIVIVGSIFLTRFEASLLFLLFHCFASVQYCSGILILKEANCKINNIRELYKQISNALNQIKDIENENFTSSILNILPDTLLRSESYLKFLFDYNNNTLDYFLKNSLA